MNELVAGESNVVDIYTLLQASEPVAGEAIVADIYTLQQVNEVVARESSVADTYIVQRLRELVARVTNVTGIYPLQKVHEFVAGETYIKWICAPHQGDLLGGSDTKEVPRLAMCPSRRQERRRQQTHHLLEPRSRATQVLPQQLRAQQRHSAHHKVDRKSVV